jgi:hypothetical protein
MESFMEKEQEEDVDVADKKTVNVVLYTKGVSK